MGPIFSISVEIKLNAAVIGIDVGFVVVIFLQFQEIWFLEARKMMNATERGTSKREEELREKCQREKDDDDG